GNLPDEHEIAVALRVREGGGRELLRSQQLEHRVNDPARGVPPSVPCRVVAECGEQFADGSLGPHPPAVLASVDDGQLWRVLHVSVVRLCWLLSHRSDRTASWCARWTAATAPARQPAIRSRGVPHRRNRPAPGGSR